MKPKALMLLAIAVGCGLVAMLGVQQAMQGGTGKAAPVETVKVLVALKDVRPGERLTEELVVFKEMPITSLSVFKGDLIRDLKEYDNRSLSVSAAIDEPIRKSKLGEPGVFGASGAIPTGKRVATIMANDTQTHAGMLRAGDKVDLAVSYKMKNGSSVTKVLLEYIEIFATEDQTLSSAQNETGKESKRAKSLSLLVTPEQFTYVQVAQAKGQISLSLRHPDDDELTNLNGINSTVLDEIQGSVGSGEEGDLPLYEQGKLVENEGPAQPGSLASTNSSTPEAAARPEPKKNDLQGFLNPTGIANAPPTSPTSVAASAAPGAAPAAPPTPVVEAPKKWSIKVYNGNAAVNVEVDDKPEPEAVGVPGFLKSLWSTGSK